MRTARGALARRARGGVMILFWLYQGIIFVALLPGLIYMALFRRVEIAERLGGGPKREAGGVWIHAASLGEFEAARGLLDAWSGDARNGQMAVTCTNAPARRQLRERLGPSVEVHLAPIDFLPLVARAFKRTAPSCLVVIETEIWPAAIWLAHRRGIPIAVVNARISGRSLPRYRFLKPLLAPILRRLTVIGCRTAEDRARWIEIGAPAAACEVWGNTKYDAGPEPERQASGPSFLLVVGSVRRGEEMILDLLSGERFCPLRMILAPRHVRDLPRWEEACLERRIPYRRLSDCGLDALAGGRLLGRALKGREPDLPDLILVDRLGVLNTFYSVADAAFVGGTWVPVGGHNLFEPARLGVGVFFGPSIDGVRDAAAILLETAGGMVVRGPGDLRTEIRRLAQSPDDAVRMGLGARQAARRLAGGVERTLKGLASLGIPPGGPS